ncbi:CPBP family intramembrane metalloprotease, partial [bacterium]|nr:CPBP family intramembrane metalloprotease [bacterium]
MSNIDTTPEFDPVGKTEKKRYFPPPNEAFLVLVAALTGAMIAGTVLLRDGNEATILIELLFLLPPILYLQVKNYDVKRCLRLNSIPAKQLVSSVLIGLALIVLLDEADRLMHLIFPMPPELLEALGQLMVLDSPWDWVAMIGGGVIAAAICEEALFRGFMQLSMEAFSGVTKAVLFCSALFALAHFNPWWLVQILILGIVLGFISWRTNSIFPCMLVHAVNNGIAILINNLSSEHSISWYS